jgi:hypothetical protein
VNWHGIARFKLKCHERLGRIFEKTIRDVVEARNIVESQRRLIEHLKSFNVPTQQKKTLKKFEANLARFTREERQLRAKAARPPVTDESR